MRRLFPLLSSTCIITTLSAGSAFAIPRMDEMSPHLPPPASTTNTSNAHTKTLSGTSTPKMQDPVVVTASRIQQPLSTVGSSMTVISGEELEKKGITEVVDALKTVPGVSFSRNGGVGQTTSLRIRGADSGQVVVMIDGVVVNDPTNTSGFYDFNALHVHNIDRIEILRGPQSAVYGGNAVGGVVNIITKRGEGKPVYTAAASAGSHNTFSQELGTRGQKGKLHYSVNASNFNTVGFPATVAGPEKDGAHLKSLSATLGVDATQHLTLDFSGGVSHLKSGFDTDPTSTDGPADQVKDSAYGQAQAHLQTLGNTLEHVFTANHFVVSRESNEPLGYYTNSTFDGTRTVFRYQVNQTLFGSDVASLGAEWQDESADNTNTTGSTPATDVDRSVTKRSAFAQYIAHPIEPLTVTFSGRHDTSSSFDDHNTARVAGAYTIESFATTLRASAGTSAKDPTLYQLYGPYGTSTLKPEESRAIDAGIENSFLQGRVTTQNTVFAQVYKNLIDFDNNTFLYGNVARARSKGFENSVNVEVVPRVNVSATHTYTLAVDSDTEKRLPRRPKHTGYVETNIRATDAWTVGGGLYFESSQLDSNFSTANTKGYGSLGLHTEYQVVPQASLYLRADNILDRHYQEVRNYRSAGREIFGGIRAEY